jgi:hypothetical protein
MKLIWNLGLRLHGGSNSGIRFFVSLSCKSVVNSIICIEICLERMTGEMMRKSGFSMFGNTKDDNGILHKILEGKIACFKELEESLGSL